MLTLTNSVSGIKVVFHEPVFINNPFKDSAWKKMSIYLPGQHQPEVMTANEGSGFMVNDRKDEQWSPDGQYMTVWNTYAIIDKDNFAGQAILFVSLEDGTEVGFETKTGSPVTTDSFRGWVKGKAHIMLYASDKPGILEEAKDIWK